jgi:hypothetical protein
MKLDLMNRQGILSTLFKNSEKTGEMSGIVKDIDDAITDYQVYLSEALSEMILTCSMQTVLQKSIYLTVVVRHSSVFG